MGLGRQRPGCTPFLDRWTGHAQQRKMLEMLGTQMRKILPQGKFLLTPSSARVFEAPKHEEEPKEPAQGFLRSLPHQDMPGFRGWHHLSPSPCFMDPWLSS